jgi:hypothetical protein
MTDVALLFDPFIGMRPRPHLRRHARRVPLPTASPLPRLRARVLPCTHSAAPIPSRRPTSHPPSAALPASPPPIATLPTHRGSPAPSAASSLNDPSGVSTPPVPAATNGNGNRVSHQTKNAPARRCRTIPRTTTQRTTCSAATRAHVRVSLRPQTLSLTYTHSGTGQNGRTMQGRETHQIIMEKFDEGVPVRRA